MPFELTQEKFGAIDFRTEVGSTSDELVRQALTEELQNLTVIATLNQTAGHGRLDRTWACPPGEGLAVSVLIKSSSYEHRTISDNLGWMALVAGTAMSNSIDAILDANQIGLQARVKWPNDVLINGLKIVGILGSVLPNGSGIVIGAGVNLLTNSSELSIPTSISLAECGVKGTGIELTDQLLSLFLPQLRAMFDKLLNGTDKENKALKREITDSCATIGARVRVDLPGGIEIRGIATGLSDAGGLELKETATGELRLIAAGDVTHLRYE